MLTVPVTAETALQAWNVVEEFSSKFKGKQDWAINILDKHTLVANYKDVEIRIYKYSTPIQTVQGSRFLSIEYDSDKVAIDRM